MRWQTSSETSSRKSAGLTTNCATLPRNPVGLSKTMLNLLELLETALPVRLADEDRKALQDELNNIAKKAAEDIRKNEKRVSIPQATFWCMVSLLVLLVAFFALVIFANIKLFHSDTLAGMIAIFSVLIAVTIVVVVLIFYKYSH